ncbi:MAG: hypothetical protein M0Z45_04705 [Actinomycetota bacterium]|nr:hypothetical protein [Actinomycetota bacterium]
MKNSLNVRIVSLRLGGVAPFEDGATLSFVASKERSGRQQLYIVPRFRMSLLPQLAIFGGAGSGKTTLVKALAAIFETVREATFAPLQGLKPRSEMALVSVSIVIAVDDRLYEYVVALQGGSVVKEALVSAKTTKDEVLFLVEADGTAPIVVPTLVTASNLLSRIDKARGEDIEAIVRALCGAIFFDPLDILSNREITVRKSLFSIVVPFLEVITPNSIDFLKSLIKSSRHGENSLGDSNQGDADGDSAILSLKALSTSEATLVALSFILGSQIAGDRSGVVVIDNFDCLLDFRITSFILGKIDENIEKDTLKSIILVMKDTVFFDQSFFRRDQLVLVGGKGGNSSVTSLAEISELRYDRDVRKMYINRLFDSL